MSQKLYELRSRARELGLDADCIIDECVAEGGPAFSSELFLFVCLRHFVGRIRDLEKRLEKE